jgi:hypothetical protein
MFFGEAGLYDGETYLYVDGFDGSWPIIDSPDRSQEMRVAYELGGYEALNPESGWPGLFSPESYAWSCVETSGAPGGPTWHKSSSGNAMELRITEPTIPNAPAQDWSRTYLVVEYMGANDAYSSFLDLPFNKVLGSLLFSRDAAGRKNVNFSGAAEVQVKISGNDRVEIIPREEMGQSIRIALHPIEFAVPDVPVVYADQPPPMPPAEPLAAEVTPTASGLVGDNYDATQAVIEDTSFKTATEMKIAKFIGENDAFKYVSGTNPQAFTLDTKLEPDQFVVRLPGIRLPAPGKLSLVIETTDPFSVHNDNATEIPLQWKENLGYVTPRQILVAHDADDDYPVGVEHHIATPPTLDQLFGLDDTDQDDPDATKASDRTHLAALGGTIRIREIRYRPTDTLKPMQVRDPQLQQLVNAKHSLRVKAYYFPDSGATPERIINDVRIANDIYAQVGVRIQLEPGYPKPLPLPTGVTDSIVRAHEFAPPNMDEQTRRAIVGTPASEGQSLIEACDRTPAELSIIYCQQILDDRREPTYAGYAYPSYACKLPNLSNSALVAGYIEKTDDQSIISTVASGMVMILAHELGHLLTNEGHFGTDYPRRNDNQKALIPMRPLRTYHNLMKQGNPSRMPGIGSNCRLDTLYQEGRIHATARFIKSKRNE